MTQSSEGDRRVDQWEACRKGFLNPKTHGKNISGVDVTLETLKPTSIDTKESGGRGQKYKEPRILTTSFRYEITTLRAALLLELLWHKFIDF